MAITEKTPMRVPTRRDPSTVRIWSAIALLDHPLSSTSTCDGLTRLILEVERNHGDRAEMPVRGVIRDHDRGSGLPDFHSLARIEADPVDVAPPQGRGSPASSYHDAGHSFSAVASSPGGFSESQSSTSVASDRPAGVSRWRAYSA